MTLYLSRLTIAKTPAASATVGANRRMPVDFDGLKLVAFSPQE